MRRAPVRDRTRLDRRRQKAHLRDDAGAPEPRRRRRRARAGRRETDHTPPAPTGALGRPRHHRDDRPAQRAGTAVRIGPRRSSRTSDATSKGSPSPPTPTSLGYRASKFTSRHRVGVVAAATIALVLIAGIVATSWQANLAENRQRAAEEALATSDMVGRVPPIGPYRRRPARSRARRHHEGGDRRVGRPYRDRAGTERPRSKRASARSSAPPTARSATTSPPGRTSSAPRLSRASTSATSRRSWPAYSTNSGRCAPTRAGSPTRPSYTNRS